MDRLVCGDVGFGKTEVAMRAMYIAALAGRQVERHHYYHFICVFYMCAIYAIHYMHLCVFMCLCVIGVQVAVLAPTRVLAMQHVRTLQERMPDVKYDLIAYILYYILILYCYIHVYYS